ncbi:MAG: hypothetical protein J1F35_02960 [Erysipelotrichales bacterium]|nr:hypothetical protein [Erysipelotrichales bacterium]
MNKITLEELNNVVPVLAANNVAPNELFDYFRVVSINNKKYEIEAKNPLYFLSYNTDKEVRDGWFINKFDLRQYVNEIIKDHPNATIVVEENMVDQIEDHNAKFIVVKSIPETIDRLFEYFKNKSHAKVVVVTGSVGKTTAVGLIESVLKNKYNTMRIYSKRITPIILKANIINFLNDEVDYVILENSLYYHDHVQVLSDLLKPDISCMLNIESCHLGVDKLQTLDDICICKAPVLKHAKMGIINEEDEHLKNINLEDGIVEYNGDPLFKTNLECLDRAKPSEIAIEGNNFVIDNKITITPFILSDLAKTQYLYAYKIGKYLGLTNEEIEKGMKEYTPVENRLNKKVAFGREIIFDGDITYYERMKALSEIKYENAYLVIRKAGCSERSERVENIVDYFDKFKKVFIFDDIEYLDELKNHPNVEVVSNHDFLNNLEGVIIYHYSGYYRVWHTFDENNLNIYDRDIYKINKISTEEPPTPIGHRRILES